MDIQEYISCPSNRQQSLNSDVTRIFQLALVMPTTDATSKHTFSAFRTFKTYLKSTFVEGGSESLVCVACAQGKTDALDQADIGDNFLRDVNIV